MKTSNRGGRWTLAEDDVLRELAFANDLSFDIAVRLNCSLPSVRARADRLGIPLGFLPSQRRTEFAKR